MPILPAMRESRPIRVLLYFRAVMRAAIAPPRVVAYCDWMEDRAKAQFANAAMAPAKVGRVVLERSPS